MHYLFFVSTISALLIKANTTPKNQNSKRPGNAFISWLKDIEKGFRIIWQVPLLFWTSITFLFLNLALAPISIILPVLVKQVNNLPAWYLGMLTSVTSAGMIVGALMLGWLRKFFLPDRITIGGFILFGTGISLLAWFPNAVIPAILMFFMGIGISCATIIMGSKHALAVPDQYRSRVNSTSAFFVECAIPAGTLLSGFFNKFCWSNHDNLHEWIICYLHCSSDTFDSKIFRIYASPC